MVVLGGGSVSYERGDPVLHSFLRRCRLDGGIVVRLYHETIIDWKPRSNGRGRDSGYCVSLLVFETGTYGGQTGDTIPRRVSPQRNTVRLVCAAPVSGVAQDEAR